MVKVNLIRTDGGGQNRLRKMVQKVVNKHIAGFLEDCDMVDWYKSRNWAIASKDGVDAFAKYLTKQKEIKN